ncbi:MAG: hypothetical protein BAJALOKI2v1_880012 [Promethearchaeota archaeon]|nr:MAG: hypothetical protein BAJALOKI2v1_880012 [Candidatus Lokiarchaeota archaeon]
MTISLQKTVTSRLGGFKDSNPEILTSYPPLNKDIENSNELLPLCLPIGCKKGEVIIDTYEKSTLISYIFSIKGSGDRDDLYSFSILLNKGINPEIYKLVLKRFIDELEKNGLLKERIFIDNQSEIYEKFNQEENIVLEGIDIPLLEIFKEIKKKYQKKKPKLKGSFL